MIALIQTTIAHHHHTILELALELEHIVEIVLHILEHVH
jgi:hypothetical protein